MEISEFRHFGRLNDPDSCAVIKGVCSDEMEFHLVFQNDVIKDIRFYTDGCGHTGICGETAARLVAGKHIDKAMAISPAMVRKEIAYLTEDHIHCSILATMTLLKAIADYLYRKSIS
ncbi:MAG: iron-sulfur cluster assembly scaffold protein [Spirochaetes bacterium]|jgi:NifU-like protein involved in Fe-S cluster formation|nr:iron-sulfur cluster assembly scaffold protein [Spirochaetota bacterium]